MKWVMSLMAESDQFQRLNRIDLNLLTVLHALLETGSTQAAADKLGRTQSAASHALRRLRETFDDPLFDRNGPKLIATPLALQLKHPVARLLADAISLVDQGTDFDPATSDRTVVIARPDVCNSVSLQLFSALMSEAPNLQITFTGPSNGPARLLGGEIDLLVSLYRRDFSSGLDCLALPNCEWATFVRQGHPISDRPDAAEWASYGHVQVSTPSPRNPIGDALRLVGHERKIALKVGSFFEALNVAASTDLLFTTFRTLVGQDARRMGMREISVPVEVQPVPMTLAVKSRSHNKFSNWLYDVSKAALLPQDT